MRFIVLSIALLGGCQADIADEMAEARKAGSSCRQHASMTECISACNASFGEFISARVPEACRLAAMAAPEPAQ